MRLSTLQIGLIVAGVLLVVGVLVYNALVERRIRRKIASTFEREGRPAAGDALAASSRACAAPTGRRAPTQRAPVAPSGDAFAIPMDAVETLPDPGPPTIAPTPKSAMADAVPPRRHAAAAGSRDRVGRDPAARAADRRGRARGRPARPARQAAPLVRPARRRRTPGSGSRRDTTGEFSEVAACLLLADRNGAASRAQLETFHRVIAELAPTLPAAWTRRAGRRRSRARARSSTASAPSSTCRSASRSRRPTAAASPAPSFAASRRPPASGSRRPAAFECVHEDTGARPLLAAERARRGLLRSTPLRIAAVPGVVLVLDVPARRPIPRRPSTS